MSDGKATALLNEYLACRAQHILALANEQVTRDAQEEMAKALMSEIAPGAYVIEDHIVIVEDWDGEGRPWDFVSVYAKAEPQLREEAEEVNGR